MNKKILTLLGAGHALTDATQGALPIILELMSGNLGLASGLLLGLFLPGREAMARVVSKIAKRGDHSV